jgi:precorrin-6B C5,15-methyltransferase / cobalt-precorrin-6B C5,C15-methyltransferase
MRNNCVRDAIYKAMNANFIVIGIDDSLSPELGKELVKTISEGKYFSGGKRHHEIVRSLLPEGAEWRDITVPLETVFEQYVEWLQNEDNSSIIIFASGDPLFFGFAVTLQKRMPEATIKVFPCFNSLQTLAHKLVMQYHDMTIVSLTGRPWDKFDAALIECRGKIGILTDNLHTPKTIAERALNYGFNNYTMYIGEALGGKEEKIGKYSLQEAAQQKFATPNCIIMQREENGPCHTPKRYFGIPESEFNLLDRREKMITKMPVRLLSLSLLDLYNKKGMWDIGFCTGSISIEAKMQFPQLNIAAFEIREEGKELMEMNSKKFGTPGIKSFICDFLSVDIESLINNREIEYPDSAFIGGHGGKLAEIVAKVALYQKKGDTIVFNSVNNPQLFTEAAKLNGYKVEKEIKITVDFFNTITCCKAIKL